VPSTRNEVYYQKNDKNIKYQFLIRPDREHYW
jgi:hypothetical protein